jgi:hypothetical protein
LSGQKAKDWYNLSDRLYPTGDLFDPETKEMTLLGINYGNYADEVSPGKWPRSIVLTRPNTSGLTR